MGLSADGNRVVLCAAGATSPGASFLQSTRGGAAVRVADECGMQLSGDGQWLLVGAARPGQPQLRLVPTGSGDAVPVPVAGLDRIEDAWHLDAHQVGLTAAELGRPSRAFLWPVASGFQSPPPVRTSGDGRFLFLRDGRVPTRLIRVELATGKRTLWRSLRPADPAGVVVIYDVRLTRDGEGYAYNYGRYFQDLFLVEGLRP